MIVCRRCNEEKEEICFTPAMLRSRNYLCKPCASVVISNYARSRRRGITIGELAAMEVAQGNVCAICKRTEQTVRRDGTPQGLSIDHDHATNKVRGLLCNRCNRAIGLMRDSPELLERAAVYLREGTNG